MNDHVRVTWDEAVPAPIREYFEPHVTRLSRIICPTWMHEVCVHYEAESEYGMWSRGEYPYRYGVLGLTGHSIRLYERDGDKALLHELTHFHIRPLQDLFQFATAQIGESGEKALDRNWTELYEGATEDLASAFAALIGAVPDAVGMTAQGFLDSPHGRNVQTYIDEGRRQMRKELEGLAGDVVPKGYRKTWLIRRRADGEWWDCDEDSEEGTILAYVPEDTP